MLCLRFSYLLWLACPWRGKAWLFFEEEQRSSGHWAQTVGGLPAECMCTWTVHKLVHLHTFTLYIISSGFTVCFLHLGGCWLIPGGGLLTSWRGCLSDCCFCFSFRVGDGVHYFMEDDLLFHDMMGLCLLFRLCVGRYPKLAKYYSLLKDRGSIKATWPPQWLASSQGYNILKDIWNKNWNTLHLFHCCVCL